jgi:hypothetical protein
VTGDRIQSKGLEGQRSPVTNLTPKRDAQEALMTITLVNRPTPDNPHSARQQRARDLNLHMIKATNFEGYHGAANHGKVLVFDFAGNRLTEPLDADAADEWLNQFKLDRLAGRTTAAVQSAPAASGADPLAETVEWARANPAEAYAILVRRGLS